MTAGTASRWTAWFIGIRSAEAAFTVAAPSVPAQVWLGRAAAREPDVRFYLRALGSRDVLLGLGALTNLGRRRELQRWIVACALADANDFVQTLVRFRRLPPRTRWVVFASTAGPAAIEALLAWALGHGGKVGLEGSGSDRLRYGWQRTGRRVRRGRSLRA